MILNINSLKKAQVIDGLNVAIYDGIIGGFAGFKVGSNVGESVGNWLGFVGLIVSWNVVIALRLNCFVLYFFYNNIVCFPSSINYIITSMTTIQSFEGDNNSN